MNIHFGPWDRTAHEEDRTGCAFRSQDRSDQGPKWQRTELVVIPRIYINPDDTLDERRKKTYDRLKQRAEREGKTVVEHNGVLIVNGVSVYSSSTGSINSN